MTARPIWLAILLAWATGWAPAADFHVSPVGNDRWTGTRPEPADGDGPFATIQRARDAVRSRRAEFAGRGAPVVIQVRGGVYELRDTLVFTPEDSGTAAAPVIYQAYPGETPILSGGRRVMGWTEVAPGHWQAAMAEAGRPPASFAQLWVNDQRRSRPTVPRDGYFSIDAAVGGTRTGRQDRFRFAPGQIDAGWRNLGDVEFVAFHKWSTSRIPLASVDAESRVVTLAGSTWHGQHAELSPAVWYRLENVADALGEPGQWYLDRASGALTLLTHPGEDPNRDEVVVPRLRRLVEFQGDVETGAFVEHIRLEGLTLAHTNWTVPRSGHSVYQAEVTMDGAVTARNARGCVLERCVIRHTGNAAVDWGAGCAECQVIGCELFDLGGGGVKIGTGRFNEEPDQRQWASACTVRDCLVAHGGRLHPAAVGIWVGHAHHNTIEHNLVFDFYYSAISVGWRWAQGPSPATANTVAWNHLHTIGQGVMSDLGGIYTLGESPGTTLRHNRIHTVSRARYGGWGLYHDESSADIVSEFNVVHDTQDAPFHLHHGRRLLLRHNIFAFGANEQLKLSNPGKSGTLVIEGNIWLWREAPFFAGRMDEEFAFRRNLYWRTDSQPIVFPGNLTAAQWQEREEGFLIADPGFADPATRDFALGPDHPARQIGFEPFDLRAAGRQTQTAATASLPAVPRTFPPAPPEPPPVIRQDFEQLNVGQVGMPGWGLMAASRDETAEVTDETAASGAHSLKLNDGPGGAVYFPHLYREVGCEAGRFRVAFALRVEPGAKLQFECRDNTPWYTPGPNLEVDPDGALKSGGRVLLHVPHGQWFGVELVGGAGPDRGNAYRCTVHLPGEEPRVFANLPLRPGFGTLGWIGFASLATERVAYYVDDFVFEPLPAEAPDVP